MNLFLRCCLNMTLIIGAFTAVSYIRPAWLEAAGADFWSIPLYQKKITYEKQRGEKLAEMSQSIAEQAKKKEAIVQTLIDKRISLKQAVEQLRPHTDMSQMKYTLRWMCDAGISEEERFCRVVIYWVGKTMKDKTQSAIRQQQLEKELQQYLNR